MLLAAVMVLSVVGMFKKPEEVKAASKYMTAKEFIILLEDEMMLPVEKGNFDSYIEMALFTKIIDKSTFRNYNKNITVAQAATMMAKADEYLFGKKISDEDAKFIIENRISDIKKVKKANRVWVAKAYGLGYLSGKSNGTWSTDRKLSLKYKVKAVNAKAMIKRLANKDERFVLSPDYQMTRTTNLPYMHEWYPYILASYPNKYYDVRFTFMSDDYYLTHYSANTAPAKYGQQGYYRFEMGSPSGYDEITLEKFRDDAIEYVYQALNTNYKKMNKDKEWQRVISAGMNDRNFETFKRIAKLNKSIVVCDKVAADLSSVHYNEGYKGTTIRVYAHFKVVSDKGYKDEEASISELVPTDVSCSLFRECNRKNMEKWGFYYDFKGTGEWREAVFDVTFKNTLIKDENGRLCAPESLVENVFLSEDSYVNRKITKYTPYVEFEGRLKY